MSWGECPALEHDWDYVLSWRNLLSGLACPWSSGRVLGTPEAGLQLLFWGTVFNQTHFFYMLFIEWECTCMYICVHATNMWKSGDNLFLSFHPVDRFGCRYCNLLSPLTDLLTVNYSGPFVPSETGSCTCRACAIHWATPPARLC